MGIRRKRSITTAVDGANASDQLGAGWRLVKKQVTAFLMLREVITLK